MRRTSLALAVLAASLSGCGPKEVWVKPGASQEEFLNDLHRCESDIQQIEQLGARSREPIDAGRHFESCMNAHGWHLERQLLPVARHGAGSFGSE